MCSSPMQVVHPIFVQTLQLWSDNTFSPSPFQVGSVCLINIDDCLKYVWHVFKVSHKITQSVGSMQSVSRMAGSFQE